MIVGFVFFATFEPAYAIYKLAKVKMLDIHPKKQKPNIGLLTV